MLHIAPAILERTCPSECVEDLVDGIWCLAATGQIEHVVNFQRGTAELYSQARIQTATGPLGLTSILAEPFESTCSGTYPFES